MNDLFWAVVLFGTGILVMLAVLIVFVSKVFDEIDRMENTLFYLKHDFEISLDKTLLEVRLINKNHTELLEEINNDVSKYTHTR